jgi:hypothetical protein
MSEDTTMEAGDERPFVSNLEGCMSDQYGASRCLFPVPRRGDRGSSALV